MALHNTIPELLVGMVDEKNMWRFGLACFARQCPTLLYFASLGMEIPTNELVSMRTSAIELLSTPGPKPNWLPDRAGALAHALDESMPDLSEGDHPVYASTALHSMGAAMSGLQLTSALKKDSISELWLAAEQVVANYLYQVLGVNEAESNHPWEIREADWMIEVGEALKAGKSLAPLIARANSLLLHPGPF